MRRGWLFGFGIPMVLLGLPATLAGVVLLTLFGLDGRATLPDRAARSDGHAVLFDAISLRGDLPKSGAFAATVGLTVRSEEPVFVGIGPAAEVARYLDGVGADRVVQVDWPGGVRTEPIDGTRRPPPPGTRDFWATSDEGAGERSIAWTVAPGDWTIVVMNADGSAGVEVIGTASLHTSSLGPIALGVLAFGLALLAGGSILTVRGAKRAPTFTTGAETQASPDAPPPRPDPTG